MEHKDYIAGIRALADFYEAHPEVKLPYEGVQCVFGIYGLEKSEIIATVKAFGKCKKEYDADSVKITKTMAGGLKLQIFTARQTVCERVVISTTIEPEKTLPGKWVEAVTIPAKEVEVVEWRCNPILEPEAELSYAD